MLVCTARGKINTEYDREIKHDISDLLTSRPSRSSIERAFAMLNEITHIC